MKKIRLDKILANSGYGSRKDVKGIVKSGRVLISDKVIKDPSYAVDVESQSITVDGSILHYKEFYYLMMNKPGGVISATVDPNHKTVIDLLPDAYKGLVLFPIGRLDKDTEGLLLLSNDGQFSHNLLSPKKHVPKTYYADVDGKVDQQDIDAFAKGIELEKDFTTLPAKLDILSSGQISKILVTIYEGKYHQVKRMFEAVDKEVLYLKRISMGNLSLDEQIALGDVRELTMEEMNLLVDYIK